MSCYCVVLYEMSCYCVVLYGIVLLLSCAVWNTLLLMWVEEKILCYCFVLYTMCCYCIALYGIYYYCLVQYELYGFRMSRRLVVF